MSESLSDHGREREMNKENIQMFLQLASHPLFLKVWENDCSKVIVLQLLINSTGHTYQLNAKSFIWDAVDTVCLTLLLFCIHICTHCLLPDVSVMSRRSSCVTLYFLTWCGTQVALPLLSAPQPSAACWPCCMEGPSHLDR